MTGTRKSFRLVAAALVVAAIALPGLAQRGSANFSRYVALGDSYGAGYSNDSLVISHQVFSYPAVIARQAGTPDFQQPLISEPGIPPELILTRLSPVTFTRKSSQNGAPINLNLPRPYSNLSIPGARVGNLITNTGATQNSNPFYQIVLRGLGTAADQALALNPTFISVWIGGNDVLGAVLAGTPAALTPIEDFTRDYNALLDRLVAGAPNAGMVVGGVADVTALPFANTIPPVLVNPATNQPVPGPGGQPIFLVAQLGDGTVGQLPPGSLVTLPASTFLATGFGIPAALAPAFPTLPDVGKPLPNAVVLDPGEIAAINARVAQVNSAISAAAAARNIPMVDIQGLLDDLREGLHFAGITLDASFLTGGIFSNDGFHPTDIGYTVIANEFIERINDAYDSEIPLASLLPFFANNAAKTEAFMWEGMPFHYNLESWRHLMKIHEVEPHEQPRVTRRVRGRR